MWLTKAVDKTVSYLVHVVVYTVPSLRRPPVLLVQKTNILYEETIQPALSWSLRKLGELLWPER